jgi:hypothetical protein
MHRLIALSAPFVFALAACFPAGGTPLTRTAATPADRPDGNGWYCVTWIHDIQEGSSREPRLRSNPGSECVRTLEACSERRNKVTAAASQGYRDVTQCKEAPAAHCYVQHKGQADKVVCFDSPGECEEQSKLLASMPDFDPEVTGVTTCSRWD